MKLRQYIETLAKDGQLKAYAARCETTESYLWVKVRFARSEPRRALREALSRESEGSVSEQEVLIHFGLIPGADQAA